MATDTATSTPAAEVKTSETQTESPKPTQKKPSGRDGGGKGGARGGKGGGRGGRGRGDKPKKEFDEVLLEVRRVTRVTTGGRQLAFRAIIVIGNRKGKIGLGVAKGADVSIAVRKATHEAYKNVVQAPVTEELTVPYGITHKYKSAIVRLMPATEGTGLKAGSSVRAVLELAGYSNILSKIIGTNNKLNNALAAIQALAKYKVGKFPERIKKKEEKKAASVKNVDTESKKTTESVAKKVDNKTEKKEAKNTEKKVEKKEAKKEENKDA